VKEADVSGNSQVDPETYVPSSPAERHRPAGESAGNDWMSERPAPLPVPSLQAETVVSAPSAAPRPAPAQNATAPAAPAPWSVANVPAVAAPPVDYQADYQADGAGAPASTGVSVAAPPGTLPARWGWRGTVRKVSGGLIKPEPGADEIAYRQGITTIRQATWTRSINIIVTNPKGGTGKTPTSLILAGILGHYRGGYVVAWEASESIGSLTRRAEGQPMRGLAELLGGVNDIRSAGNLGGYTAPQTSHSDVIGSVARRPVLSAQDVVSVRRVLDTYYRITVTDSGNNPGHEAYAAALATADAAVLPCLVSIDALAGVEEALSVMGDDPETARGLRSRVVVVLGHDGGPEDAEISAALRRRLKELGVAAVLEVPFDPAIRLGGEISLSSLSEDSTHAWTAVAAAVVTALRTAPTDVDLVSNMQARIPGSGN
jgi:MinD-like ATPase involved in chromosome partitioning or flagellar assembly